MRKFNEEQKKYIENYDGDIDLAYFIENADAEDVDGLEEYIQDNGGFDVEIIYYRNAIDYLSEHDASLTHSLELAHDMGCELANLNSETLASLLASEHEREHFADARDDIQALFYEND